MDEIQIMEGTRVELELVAKDKSRERLNIILVNDDAADFDKGLLGLGTPLAKTLLGHIAGETLAYNHGDIVQVIVLSAQENAHAVIANAGDQREEALRRARDKAQHANMVSFALTFDSKWGDYNLDMFDVTAEPEQVGDPTNIQQDRDIQKEDSEKKGNTNAT